MQTAKADFKKECNIKTNAIQIELFKTGLK